eukprot:5622464-Prymnesium_polylepis.1
MCIRDRPPPKRTSNFCLASGNAASCHHPLRATTTTKSEVVPEPAHVIFIGILVPVSYTHLRAHETLMNL